MDKLLWIFILLASTLLFHCQTRTIVENLNTRSTEVNELSTHVTVEDPQLLHENQTDEPFHSSFRVLQVPRKYFDKSFLLVEAECRGGNGVLWVEVLVSTESRENATVFSKNVSCRDSGGPRIYKISLKLPRYIAYRPSYLNRYSVFIDSALVRCWIEERKENETIVEDSHNNFAKFESILQISKPFERPARPVVVCLNWYNEYLSKRLYLPQCLVEEADVFEAVKYPVALSGFMTGVHRVYDLYRNPNLRRRQLESFRNPTFTFVMWLYIEEYCISNNPHSYILHHITWDDKYATPLILVTNTGQVSVELIMEDGTSLFRTSQPGRIIPRHTWTRLMLSCLPKQCNLTASYGQHWTIQWVEVININQSRTFYYDDTIGLVVYGGSELGRSFKGYIGRATYYRRRAIRPEEAGTLGDDEVSLKLELNARQSKCHRYVEHVNHLVTKWTQSLQKIIRRNSCTARPSDLFYNKLLPTNVCPEFQFRESTHYKLMHDLVKSYVYRGWPFHYEDIARNLHSYAEDLLNKKGPGSMELVISLLKQSSCLGNHDSSFMLSAILNYGLTIKSQEIQSHSYLMYGALEGNRLCLISLGNKHVYGLDGFPEDFEQAYVYFKSVADMTNRDLEKHSSNDVFTEMVRLTNDIAVKKQTNEDGDDVIFLRLQAAQGVLHAQHRLARMYYWGSGGIARDIDTAFRYYSMAAESNDPASLYDFGIVLLKGHGTQKNVTMALEMLKRSAEQGFPHALNALGWYALEVTKNMTEAAEYFQRSHDLGNKDASYNLGHMLLKGKYPNSTVDKVRAWEYLSAGALRGQYEAGILVGMYNLRGHPKITRSPELAVGWTRFVAERNPGIGRLLSKGVKAYKAFNWFSALVYYLMAATTGVEVANFNLAYLCDEDSGDYVKHLEKECKWRHYNLSTQRALKDVDPYALNKMAHYYYYHGINGRRDEQAAIIFCFNAAVQGDPQGLYNLAMLVEDGVNVPEFLLTKLRVPQSIRKEKILLVTHLLMRCQDSHNQESYLPCTFAMYRIISHHYWNLFLTHLTSILVIAVLVLTALASYRIIYWERQTPRLTTISN